MSAAVPIGRHCLGVLSRTVTRASSFRVLTAALGTLLLAVAVLGGLVCWLRPDYTLPENRLREARKRGEHLRHLVGVVHRSAEHLGIQTNVATRTVEQGLLNQYIWAEEREMEAQWEIMMRNASQTNTEPVSSTERPER